MKSIYVFGHKNPDTDSVTASISLSYLKRKLGYKAVAVILGDVNSETEFVLNYFNVKKPKYLNDLRLQIKDINYHKNCFIHQNATISDTYEYMNKRNITGLPIIDDFGKFVGIVTAKILLKAMFEKNGKKLKTSYDNIVRVLNGNKTLKFNEEIEGNLFVAAYKSATFIEEINLTNDDILIVGNRNEVIENSINKKIKLLIIVGNAKIKEEHILLAKTNKINIITTKLDTYNTIKKIELCNYIKELIIGNRSYKIYENDYYSEFIKEAKKLKYNNYPVVNKDGVCKGLLRLTEASKKYKKQVILVDHNEFEQSADGIEEAEILEVIDHHKIGAISTNYPINFRSMAVGSSNTIIYNLFKENRVEIPYAIAGLMLSGILSDTLALTSLTTTEIDREAVLQLQQICKLDYKSYAMEMLASSCSIKNKTNKQIITTDMKLFNINNKRFAISQIFTMKDKEVIEKTSEFILEMEKLQKESNLEFVLTLVTDIIKQGTYLIYTRGAKEYLEEAFKIEQMKQGKYIEGFVSRKKQVLPLLMEALE